MDDELRAEFIRMLTEDGEPEGISDEALLAFAQWCRLNHPRTVYDPVLLRRVLDAYSASDTERG